MTTWTLVRRTLRTHRAAAAILALVVGLGAFLGAAAPRWADDRLDDTLRDTIAQAGATAQLSARDTVAVAPATFDGELDRLRASAGPELTALLGEGRWSSHTGGRFFGTQNGTEVDDGLLPRRLDVRVPHSLEGKLSVVDGDLPSTITTEGELSVLDIVATRPVAEALRLQIGDVVSFDRREATGIDAATDPDTTHTPAIRLTGIVEPADPDDPFWSDARTATEPDLGEPGAEPRITTGTLISARELLGTWTAATGDTVDTEWHVAVDPSAADASALDAVTADMRRITNATMWSSGLTDSFAAYPEQRSAAEGVVAFGIVSLAALCAALTVLSIRNLADRRADEVALARARGAGDAVLVRLLALDAAVVAVPASVLGALAAVVAVPGDGGVLGWMLAAAPAALAVPALPLVTMRAAVRSGLVSPAARTRADVAAVRPSARRLVAEATAVLVAGLGLWLAGSRQPGAGVDPVVSLAPILVAGATGLLIFRAMPYLLAAVAPALRRAAGATAFLAVTRTARAPGHAVLPVVALLVAIGVATFGGTVQASVEQARQNSSWNEVAGDVVVESDVVRSEPEQIAALPGTDALATGHVFTSRRPINLENGRAVGVDILAVDVPAWQRVTAPAPQTPDVVAALSRETESGAPAAVLKGSVDVAEVGDTLEVTLGEETVAVEIVESLAEVPGATSGTTLVVPEAPLAAAMPPWPDVVYVGGEVSGDAVAGALGIEASSVTLRSDVLHTIYGDTMLTAVLDVFGIVTVLSAVLAGGAAILGLTIGERPRLHGLSVLRTLGLTTRQSAALTAAEMVPVSIVAAVAGIGVGTGTGLVIAGALDLPALSGALSGDAPTVTDLPAAVLAAAAVLGVVLLAVGGAVVAARRAGLGSVLRAGEPT